MILITYEFLICFYLSILIIIDCSTTSSSILLNRLKKHKTITFQSTLSSPKELNIEQNMKFNLTCSFLSNFPQIDIFWLHNGTLIQSFISKSISNEEDSFLAVSIVSTISIEKIHFDMNGFYQCIGVHQEVYAQQTFSVNINLNDISLIPVSFSRDASFVVHTVQALFEPRNSISLLCRISEYKKKECQIQWFDPNEESLDMLGENTDLVIKNATFELDMGLYTCQICCASQCQKLTSFIYPTEEDEQN
ncbi:hypothetical protein I4U23_031218 [Adineta vaga]|nr:hypothetical protein I4U23_031218 [Adineta vaga]